MSAGRVALTALAPAERRVRLEGALAALSQPAYRARRVLQWVIEKRARTFDAMSDLPLAVRRALAALFRVHGLREHDRVPAADGSCKFIFMGDNDAPVESVLLPAPDGATYCLSVACGCPVGCAFCASGTFFRRHLAAGEILDQYLLMRAISGDDPPFSGIVLMGMGEPLLNWRGTRGFLEDMTRNAGVGARRITVSTVGVPRGIAALGESFPQVKLAVSLHAADDALRRRLVPYAARVNLRALMAACRRHAELTRGRRITFEYVLLAGVNDRAEDAARLASLVRGLPAAVNLIPFNPTAQGVFARPSDAAVEAFARALRRRFRGEVVVRRSLGAGVHAACGQLGAQCASRAGT